MAKWLSDLFPPGPLSLPLRIGAVLVAAGVGALAAGVVVQLLSKGVTRERAPRFAVNLVRGAGAIAAGLAAFLLLFGTGGGFGFGGGGTGSGTNGTGDKAKDKSYSSTPDPRKSDEKSDTNTTKSDPDTLRIEILGNDTVRKAAGQAAVDESRRYRVTDSEGKKELITLPQLEQKLARSDPVPRHLVLAVYRWDTGDSDYTATMRRLEVLAKDLKKVKKEWIEEKVIDSPPMP
jgi:hypothetical protein